jgi:hypothetical protein
MERASAINLVLLGGGLTIVGATMTLGDHNRRVACERAHPDNTAACHSASGGYYYGGGHSGGGYARSGGGYLSESGISRGGFGGFGRGFGGGG